MTFQYIDIANKILGNNIAALKCNTAGNKPIHVAGDIVRISKELVKLHKEVFTTADILFINGIPLFIFLSCKIIFTVVRHLSDRKSNTIFKDFKEIYIYYMKRGFWIKTLHVYGESAPLQELIHDMHEGPHVNLESSSEHVSDTGRQIQVEK